MVDPRAVGVALRAQEIALADGTGLPDDLALWQLAGGRPAAVARPGRPEDLGVVLEGAHDLGTRHRRGVHYTPEHLATGLVARALAGTTPRSICDPTCGGGALLLAAGRALADRGMSATDALACLWGADIDPLAVATTEAALTLWARARPEPGHLEVADTLLDPPRWAPFDIVVGNPPFLSQLDASTTRSAEANAQLRAAFGPALGAYTDTGALFLLRSTSLCRSGGRVVLVQPQSVLAARDAHRVRELVGDRASLREVWVPAGRPFRAAVDACVVVLDMVPGRGEEVWSAHLAEAQGVPRVVLDGAATVGDVAVAGAPFRAEYYGLAPHVRERKECPGGRPLLTTGLVDLSRSWWGVRPARMARRSWHAPVVDSGALVGRASAWAARTLGPKLVVATQTRVIEVVVDEEGEYLPSVPLVVVWSEPDRLWHLAAALASPPVTAWASTRVAGTALSRGSIRISAALIRAAPLPSDHDAWQAGTDALRAGSVVDFAEAMTAAYSCDAAVGDWWLARLGSAWSAETASR